MNNASFHKKHIKLTINDKGCILEYSPTYNSEFYLTQMNPSQKNQTKITRFSLRTV